MIGSLRHPVERERIDDLAAVEEDPLHRRVDDEEKVALAAELRDDVPRLPIEHRARRHRRAHHQEHARAIVDGGAEAVEVEAPAGRARLEPGEAWHAAGDPHPVQQPGVDRIGEHDLVARLERGEQDVEDPVQAAGGDQRLTPVDLVHAAADVGGDGSSQPLVPGEREVAVRVVVVDRGAGRLERSGEGPKIRVEVLEPEELGVGRAVGGVAHAVDADPGNTLETGDRHRAGSGERQHGLAALAGADEGDGNAERVLDEANVRARPRGQLRCRRAPPASRAASPRRAGSGGSRTDAPGKSSVSLPSGSA